MYKYFLLFILFFSVIFLMVIFQRLTIVFANLNYYNSLKKLKYTPSIKTFNYIWNFLYLLIAISGVLIWENEQAKFRAFHYWAIFLFFNMIWSFLFFYIKKPFFALIDGLASFIFLVLCIAMAFRFQITASLLLFFVAIWLGFEIFWNYKIVLMNRKKM